MARLLVLLALALAVAVPAAAGGATRSPKAPKSGWSYAGQPGDVTLRISGRSVEIAAFSFPCGEVYGRTSVNDFRLKRTSKGYRFNADAHAIVTYTDETDANAEVHISGRFALDAKTVRGHIRAKSARCDTGDLKWRGTRSKR
ncbi:MAG TPA: hypothetical protein VF715_03720 [Thermoleophilaceae bacterium]|jgi:hypothetical protein